MMEMWTDRNSWNSPSAMQIDQAIKELRVDEPAVLGPSNDVFIQTMLTKHGYLLEKRDGDDDHHFEAIPKDNRERVTETPAWWMFWAKQTSIFYFTADEIIRAFQDYQRGKTTPDFVTWSKIRL